MKKLLCSLTLLFTALFHLEAQDRFLLLDRYGKRQIKLTPGDDVRFSTREHPKTRYHDLILGLGDSSMYLQKLRTAVPLKAVRAFYFRRTGWKGIRKGSYLAGTGFLLAAATQPNTQFFHAGESLVIGTTILAFGQLTRLWDWKVFRIGKRGRARVMDLRFAP